MAEHGGGGGGGLPPTAFALVTVGGAKPMPWDVNVLDMNNGTILDGLSDPTNRRFKARFAGVDDIGACSVYVATAGVEGETELEGAMPVRAVPHLKTPKEYGKHYVHLRIELPAAAAAGGGGGGGGGGGPIGALLLCGRRWRWEERGVSDCTGRSFAPLQARALPTLFRVQAVAARALLG